MEDLILTLHNGDHSLAIRNGGVRTFDGRGVTDLHMLLHEEPKLLRGAQIADKVVGKGAAALMALGNVEEVYADVISQPALDLLTKSGIKISYGKVVPNIINRTGTGFCPVETRCMSCKTPEECLVEIDAFIAEMKRR